MRRRTGERVGGGVGWGGGGKAERLEGRGEEGGQVEN